MLWLYVYVITGWVALAVLDLCAAIRRPDRRAWRQFWVTSVVHAVLATVWTAIMTEWL